MTLVNRNGTFHLVRRVPARFQRIDQRTQVWISTGSGDHEEAERIAERKWRQKITMWEAIQNGDTSIAEERYAAARQLCHSLGFRFLTPAEVSELPLPEVLERIDAVFETGELNKFMAEAVLGAASEPEITMTRALEIYWTVAGGNRHGKSPDQVRRMRAPRRKAFRNFIDVIGDLPINQLTADDMIEFRVWWLDRVEREGLTMNSANKDMTYLASTLRAVNRHKHLRLQLPLEGLALPDKTNVTRPPFPTEWIRDKILSPGALAGLPDQARCLVMGMINTGFRPSEGAALTADTIVLDAEVPHICIEPAGRTLKSKYAQRVIPLVGTSLAAFRECPKGFPRYADNPALSATVNSYFRAHGLIPPNSGCTMYSLRHSFEDRLLDADVDERIRRDLMGHRLTRETYGKGATLEKMQEELGKIAL